MRPRIGGPRGVTHGLRVSRVPDCVGARSGWIEKSVALGFAQSMKHHHCIWSATFLGTPAVFRECYSMGPDTNFYCSPQSAPRRCQQHMSTRSASGCFLPSAPRAARAELRVHRIGGPQRGGA